MKKNLTVIKIMNTKPQMKSENFVSGDESKILLSRRNFQFAVRLFEHSGERRAQFF